MKIVVYHGAYGCETGCCGHWIKCDDQDGYEHTRFDFEHPYDPHETPRQFAERLVASRSFYMRLSPDDLEPTQCGVVDEGRRCPESAAELLYRLDSWSVEQHTPLPVCPHHLAGHPDVVMLGAPDPIVI